MRCLEESGQGDSYTAVIDNQKLKSYRRSWVERAIAALFWGAFIYCIFPIWELITDYSGLPLLTGNDTGGHHSAVLADLIAVTAGFALLAIGAFALWIAYNYACFKIGLWKNRRATGPYKDSAGILLSDPRTASGKAERRAVGDAERKAVSA